MNDAVTLTRPDLLRTDAFIGGRWIAGERLLAVTNPATGALIAAVADTTPADTRAAIDAAGDWETAADRAAEAAERREAVRAQMKQRGEERRRDRIDVD